MLVRAIAAVDTSHSALLGLAARLVGKSSRSFPKTQKSIQTF
jgi:hypothetical protein